jgi:hypothetical protein
MNKNNIQAAAFFMLISVTGFSLMDLSVKWTTATYPIGEVIFFRMVFGLIPLFLQKNQDCILLEALLGPLRLSLSMLPYIIYL